MTSPWTDGEYLNAATMYARTTALIQDNPVGFLAENNSTTAVTLTTTGTQYAGSGPATFTVPGASGNRRIKLTTKARFLQTGATNARFALQVGYNSGATVVIGGVAIVGVTTDASTAVAGTNGYTAAVNEATAILAAGSQFTAYPVVQRVANGDAASNASGFYTLVEDLGAA